MELLAGNPSPQVIGLGEMAGKSNYFRGSDPQKWLRNIPHYSGVEYRDVYPGIDFLVYGNQGQLEYDFDVAPGVDPQSIRLGFFGIQTLSIDKVGNLIMEVPGGQVIQKAPIVYQEIDGAKRAVPGGYVLTGEGEVGFKVGSYDVRRPLIIDPVLVYSTYLGGAGLDRGNAVAVDASGSAYVTGETASSTDFPLTNVRQPIFGGTEEKDVFVTKMKADGSDLAYSTYLGGSDWDVGHGIAVDSAGSAYVTGETNSSNFPTSGAIFSSSQGSVDAFVTKLSPDGSEWGYSTYLGGSSTDIANAVAVDSAGNAYVTGETSSTNFPRQDAIQSANAGRKDVFVTKIIADGSTLAYSTYFGGAFTNQAHGISIDAAGNIYVTGQTDSLNFPVSEDAFQKTRSGSSGWDAFVAKFNILVTAPLYATYLGGSQDDIGYAIAVDAAGNAFVTGVKPAHRISRHWMRCKAAPAEAVTRS